MAKEKSVLIIGAGGFTGRYVSDVVRASEGWVAYEGTAEGIDILDARTLLSAVERIKPDAIINLAAVSALHTDNVPLVYRLNGLAVVEALYTLDSIGFQGRFVTASSALVYGSDTPEPITELSPLKPEHHYSIAKATADKACEMYQDKLDVVVTRPFNCIGIGHKSSFVVPKIVSHFRQGLKSIRLGNVSSQRDFVDIRDVSLMYLAILNAPSPPPAINLCSGKSTSILDLIECLQEISGQKIDIRVDPDLVRKKDSPFMCGDNSRLLSLPFEYQYGLDQTLKWMLSESVDTIPETNID